MTSATSGEDDTMGMEAAGKAIVRHFGQTGRDRVLAGIYLSRSDVALQVRQVASHVWKIVVANTPRTLKEIMKTLFEMLLGCLASSSEDRQQMAGRCLGELVKKMGERIIIDVLPVLEAGLSSTLIEQRVGVAIALREIIDNTTKDVILMYSNQLSGPIKRNVCDSNKLVRQAAALAFTSLYETVGHSVFDDIVGPLIERSIVNDENVLNGLCEIMRLSSRQMLPYVLPKLTKPPINVRVLCALSAVAGDSLSRNVDRILASMLDSCSSAEEIDQCLQVILSVTDSDGILTIINTLLHRARTENHVSSSALIHQFVKNTKVDVSNLIDQFLHDCLLLYISPVDAVVENAIDTLMCVSQKLDQRQQIAALIPLKRALNSLQSSVINERHSSVFSHQKALNPLLPIVRESILSGSSELKEAAGETLGTLIIMSTPLSLKPHVISITGPLIRVLGDRYSHNVKIGILSALSKLLDKVDIQLRPFLPQLQSTFLKALQDPASRKVRLQAGGALCRLVSIHMKPELVIGELTKFLKSSMESSLIETSLIALRAVLLRLKVEISEAIVQDVLSIAKSYMQDESSEHIAPAAAALYGELVVKTGKFDDLITELKDIDSQKCFVLSVAMQYICCTHPQKIIEAFGAEKLRGILIALMQNDKPLTACSSVRAVAGILLSQKTIDASLLTSLLRIINHSSNDVKCVAALGIHYITTRELTMSEMKIIVPMLVNGVKEKNSSVRAACEQALISIFKMRSQNPVYEQYVSTIEGAAREVLIDANKTLQKLIKHSDPGLDSLSDIVNVP